jgi:Sulfotransferase family
MKPVFIGGCGRSGTTLLAALLAEHPAVVAPPEAQFLIKGLHAAAGAAPAQAPGRFAAAVRSDWRLRVWELPGVFLPGDADRPADVMRLLVREYARSRGRPEPRVWVDHTPSNVLHAKTLLDEFPDAVMIHLVRDPRAVAASVLPLDWGPASPRDAGRWWLTRVAAGLAAEVALPGRVIRVHYEELVNDPRTVTRLHEVLGLDPGAELRPDAMELPRYTRSQHTHVGRRPDPARIDAWRARLSAKDVAALESELGDTLVLLGYEPVSPRPAALHPRGLAEAAAAAAKTGRQRVRAFVRRRRLV